MKHAEHLVDLVDENGTVVGSKPRGEVNKQTDLYNTVFGILCTPDGELILGKIPDREDLPNLYIGSLGATVATIRRHGETSHAAGIRAVKNELFIDDIELTHLGNTYLELPDGLKKYMSVYSGIHPVPPDFSHTDIDRLVTFSPSELRRAMQFNEDQFAPTFRAIWQRYEQDLL